MRTVIHIRWPEEGKLSSQQRATLNGVLGRDNYDVAPIGIEAINELAQANKLDSDFGSLFTNGHTPEETIAVIFTVGRELSSYELKVYRDTVRPRLGANPSAPIRTFKWAAPAINWSPVVV